MSHILIEYITTNGGEIREDYSSNPFISYNVSDVFIALSQDVSVPQ